MITVKSIKKEWIWDLVTCDDELRAYACEPDFQARKAAITDAILRREAEGYKVFGIMATKKRPDVYDFYTKMLREQAVACVKDALRDPLEPVLKDGVMTIRLYVLNCGFVTSDPIRLTYCVHPVTYLEDNLDKSKSELGMRLLYALEQSGQRISVSFTYPDDLEEDECDFISRYDGYDELVNALVDAVLERLMGHTGEIWD